MKPSKATMNALGLAAILGIASPSPSQAGACWICDHVDNMYVCIGVGNNNGLYDSCGPTWDFEPPFDCKHDSPPSCGSSGCPGCYRFPAAAVTKPSVPSRTTTQILVFRTIGVTPTSMVQLGSPASDHLTAKWASTALSEAGVSVKSLISYSCESTPEGTASLQFAQDGSGFMLCATPSRSKTLMRLGRVSSGRASTSWQAFVQPGRAIAFRADVAGEACVVVACASETGMLTTEEVVAQFHTPLAESAHTFPSVEPVRIASVGPYSDSPGASMLLGFQVATRGIATQMAVMQP